MSPGGSDSRDEVLTCTTPVMERCFVRHYVPECQQDGLAIDEECNLSQPCSRCDRNDNVIFVPNCNPSGNRGLASEI